MLRVKLRFKQKANKKAIADNRQTPSLTDQELAETSTDGELEDLTAVRVRFGLRARIRGILVKETQAILDFRHFLDNLNQYALSSAYVEYLYSMLRRRWAVVLGFFARLREQEDHDNATMRWWQE
ncbi:hypothetical protein N7519_001544 [Penicillium mononematosum]|uniref:uncharacterized protein n=1 Tax=Penicillium mononematosum TaxID=268346 RepID=UPI002547AD57|nr:uncharacterized protein N7519_001544 [Penicillium mononematosum]KAJ6191523.1 hypothetical protein N7519_001544 [Penicillium mononematosum]